MTDPQNPDVPPPPPAYNTAPPPAYDTAPPAGQPVYSSAPPAPYGAPANPTVPGRTLGIVALIVAIFFNVIGLILGIVALVQSRKAGHKNGWAVAAIIVGAVLTVLGIIIAIAVFTALAAAAGFTSEALEACTAVDFTGTVTVQGVTVDCATFSR
jgi:heme/copper-type cytochrome/quinol oxidase subunit 2